MGLLRTSYYPDGGTEGRREEAHGKDRITFLLPFQVTPNRMIERIPLRGHARGCNKQE